jgi:WD40 repeat protein
MKSLLLRFSVLASVSLALFSGCVGTSEAKTTTAASQTTAWTPTWTAQPSTKPYYINSVAISGNASISVAGTFFHSYSAANSPAANSPSSTGTFGTYAYNAAGQQIWKDEFVGWQGVYWVDISSDGTSAASGGWYSYSPMNGFVRAYNATNGQRLLNYLTTARVNQVCLSSDGSWLLSAANTLVLFQRVNGVYQKSDEYIPAASDTMETIALSANGSTVVAGDYAGSIMLFSIQNGKFGTPATWALPGGGYSHCVRITPDGKAFAAGGSSGNFYLCNTAQFRTTPGPTVTYQVAGAGSVYGVAIANDASAFAGIVNTSKTGCVYYVGAQGATGTLLWKFATQHNPNSVWLNSGAKLMAVADGHPDNTPGAFYLLNTNSGGLISQFGTSNMSWPIMISVTGRAVVAGSDNSTVYYFPSFPVPPTAPTK